MKKPVLVIIIVSAVVAVGFWLWWGAHQAAPPSTLATVNQDDMNRLQADGDEAEKAKSLRRMATQNPTEAPAFAKNLAQENSAVLRAAAFEVAGGFQGEEWDKFIFNGLRDPDLTVRLATLKGLNRQPTASRKKMVEEFLADKQHGPEEQLWAHMAIMYAVSESSERQLAEKRVLALLLRVDRAHQSQALVELYKIWPNRSEVFTFAEKVVGGSSESDQDFYPSFHYLSNYAPQSLAAVLNSIKWPESRYFLMETASFLGHQCPKNWPALLKKLESQRLVDEGVKAEIAKWHPGQRCKK